MKEVPQDDKWIDDGGSWKEPNRVPPASDVELMTLTLLMRLYDIGLALLSNVNEEDATKVLEAHARGEVFNPAISIPTFTEKNDNE